MSATTLRPVNFTRTSPNLVRKFVRERRFHFIPLYWLLRLSDFAREGMDRSASYRFADHLYRGLPSGRGWIGRWIDGLLLRLPASRAMRARCFAAERAMHRAFERHLSREIAAPFHLLTVPCGLPRDVFIFASRAAAHDRTQLARITYTGLDVDPEVVHAARLFLTKNAPALDCHWLRGDALQRGAYPETPAHFISSTGLGEFLDDTALRTFYQNVFAALAPRGTFFTSATALEKRAERLLEAFELRTHYRTAAEIERLLSASPWAELKLTHDPTGLQTFVEATKA